MFPAPAQWVAQIERLTDSALCLITGGVLATVDFPSTDVYDMQTLDKDTRWFSGSSVDPAKAVSMPPLRLECDGSRPIEEFHLAIQVRLRD